MSGFIRDCLESLGRQTLSEFEAICVDDGSTDSTPDIIREYAGRDSRIVLISQKNEGVFAARNRAMARARGEYLCFLDPDDWYPEDGTLSKMYKAAVENDADICGGGWSRHFPDGKVVDRFEGNMAGLNAFAKCGFVPYSDYQFDLGYQRFLYRRSLIRSRNIEFPPYKRYQDPPFFVKAMAAAGRFYGLDFTTYCYRVGHKSVDWASDGYRKLKDYMRGLAENLRTAREHGLDVLRRTTYERCCGNYFWQTAGSAIAGNLDVFNVFLSMFDDAVDAVHALAKGFANHSRDIAGVIERSGWIKPIVPRDVKVIGMHYFHLTPGGVQRVIAIQVRQFLEMGYKVRLFVEEPVTGECFKVPEEVEVVKFPETFGKNGLSPAARVQAVAEVLRAHPVDVFYSHCHVCPMMFWDILTVKAGLGIPYVLHFHSMFSAMLHGAWETSQERFLEAPAQHRFCDLVISLSRVDCAYEMFNGARSVYLPNPVDDVLKRALPSGADGERRRVMWIGRIDENKQPADALKVFAKVHEALPDVRFRMVGGGAKWLEDRISRDIKALGLESCVERLGSKLDVYPDYAASSVYLSTSRIEGFPMCSLEALCHGLPIVAYRLPQAELYRDNPSVVQVRQGDVASAAAAIVRLLESPDLPRLREEARMSVQKFVDYDFKGAWHRIMEMLQSSCKSAAYVPTEEDYGLMRESLFAGIDAMRGRVGSYRRQLAERDRQLLSEKEVSAKASAAAADLQKCLAETRVALDDARKKGASDLRGKSALEAALRRETGEVAALKASEAYRVGMAVTWPARKVWGGVKCLRENGPAYTVKHFLGKVARRLGFRRVKW